MARRVCVLNDVAHALRRGTYSCAYVAGDDNDNNDSDVTSNTPPTASAPPPFSPRGMSIDNGQNDDKIYFGGNDVGACTFYVNVSSSSLLQLPHYSTTPSLMCICMYVYVSCIYMFLPHHM